MCVELRLAGLAPIFLDHLLDFVFPPDVWRLVGVHLQPLPPAHVEGRLPDQGTHGPPGHHHAVHQGGGQAHPGRERFEYQEILAVKNVLLSNLSGQFDSQKAISERMNKYHQTNIVDRGHEVAQWEVVSVLDTLQPGEDDPLVPGPSLALASAHLPPGCLVLLQLQRQGARGGGRSAVLVAATVGARHEEGGALGRAGPDLAQLGGGGGHEDGELTAHVRPVQQRLLPAVPGGAGGGLSLVRGLCWPPGGRHVSSPAWVGGH